MRINGLDTPWGADDAHAMDAAIAAGARIDAILIPKVNHPDDLDPVARLVPGTDRTALLARLALPPGHIDLVSTLTNLGLVRLERSKRDELRGDPAEVAWHHDPC